MVEMWHSTGLRISWLIFLWTGLLVAAYASDDVKVDEVIQTETSETSSVDDNAPKIAEFSITTQEEQWQRQLEEAQALLNKTRRKSDDLPAAVALLTKLAEDGSADAMFALAELYERGERDLPRNMTRAIEYFTAAADKGHEAAQTTLGFYFAAGLGVPRDEIKSLLYLHFAAMAGHTEAQLALGYRYLFGLGVPTDCQLASQYYVPVTEKVVAHVQKPGNAPVTDWPRLHDGVDLGSEQGEDDDVVQYYQYSAEHGDVSAQMALGNLFYWGNRNVPQNVERAFKYFSHAALQGDPNALSNLGHMYLHGIGVAQDNATGLRYFRLAAEKNNSAALNGLGYSYMYGYGVPISYSEAFKYFKRSADQQNPEGQFNLGTMFIGGVGTQQNYDLAFQYFTFAALQGHTLALYNLGLMHLNGLGTEKDCQVAVKKYLKPVAERGPWAKRIQTAYHAFLHGDIGTAIRGYVRSAEQGFESAISSAGWLYDRGPVREVEEYLGLGVASTSALVAKNKHDRQSRALRLYLRAAEQGNTEAEIRAGDFYYYGMGTPVKFDAASSLYRHAGEQSRVRHPQALYNVGYMHEYGLGLAKDFHLAKRYYDMALTSHPDAYVPSSLALARLWLHMKWIAMRQRNWNSFLSISWDGMRDILSRPDADIPASAPDIAAPAPPASTTSPSSASTASDVPSAAAVPASDSSTGDGGGDGDDKSGFVARTWALVGSIDGLQQWVAQVHVEWDLVIAAILSGLLALVVYLRQQRRLRVS